MSDALLACLAVAMGMSVVMSLAWIVQRAVGNAGWTDVFWTFGSGGALAVAAVWPAGTESTARQSLVAALAMGWALRLGLMLTLRVARFPEDVRYRGLRDAWGEAFQHKLFGFALKQAPATGLLAVSVYVAAHNGSAHLGWRDAFGAAIMLIAVFGEGIADEQMRRFKARSIHGAVMAEGLWAWSRHPNYFFEWLSWLAYPAIVFDPRVAATWSAWLAPALMFVILRYGTGVPMIEASMLASRGDMFRRYQARVGCFFPAPPKS